MITTRSDGREKKRANAPIGGYKLSCCCGWDGGTCRIFKDAEKVFAAHVESVARYLCKSCDADISTETPQNRKLRECTACRKDRRAKELEKATKEGATEHRAKRRDAFIRSKYGMREEDLQLILMFQNNECKICGSPIVPGTKSGLHIDHCHRTGRIRGLLCIGCNMGLGSFKDDPSALLNAIAYLFTEPTIGHEYQIPYHERLTDSAKKANSMPSKQEMVAIMRRLCNRLELDDAAERKRSDVGDIAA
nr:endonuclease VII domain-containing protein [Rhizobium azibense]